MQKYDVAVIGLGAVGSAALYQLSKLNLRVIGIDRFAPPHSHGSSHGESRINRQAIGEGKYYTPLSLRTNQIWKELEDISGKELHNACGLLMISEQDNEFLKTTVDAAKDFSIKHELLDSAETQDRFPAITMAKDEVAYFEPGGGFIRPENCIDAQIKTARDNGAEVLINTKVAGIKEGSTVIITLEDGEKIIADKVILASGSWIKDFLPEELARLFKIHFQTLYWFDIEKDYLDDLRPQKLPAVMCKTNRIAGPEHYSFYGFPALSDLIGGVKFAIHDIPPEIDPEQKDATLPVAGAAELL
jgi:sarcosine oxidase